MTKDEKQSGWVILGLVALVLAFTNPNEKDFKYEIVKKIQESGEIDDLNPFQKLMVGIASYAIDSVTERKNYLIFSIFEIDSSLIKIINPDTPRLKFVGIAGQIIPLFQSKSFAEDNLTTNENNTKSETEASAVIYKNDEPPENVKKQIKQNEIYERVSSTYYWKQ